jgi:hypothetical protein
MDRMDALHRSSLRATIALRELMPEVRRVCELVKAERAYARLSAAPPNLGSR